MTRASQPKTKPEPKQSGKVVASRARAGRGKTVQRKPRSSGRPTGYQPSYAAEMLEFFDPAKALAVVKSGPKGVQLAEFPLMSGFAWKLGVSRQTLLNWTKAHPEFLDAYARAREAQEVILASAGLRGAYNPTFAYLTAKNILGWRDKVEQEVTGPEGGPLRHEVEVTNFDALREKLKRFSPKTP